MAVSALVGWLGVITPIPPEQTELSRASERAAMIPHKYPTCHFYISNFHYPLLALAWRG